MTDLNSNVVWMVSTRPLFSKSCNLFINPFLTVPITIGITVTFMFYCIFSYLAMFRYFSLSFRFTQWLVGKTKSTIFSFLILLTASRSGRLAEIRWLVGIRENFVRLIFQHGFWIAHITFVRGVMVIVLENGHGDTSSNRGRDWLHYYWYYYYFTSWEFFTSALTDGIAIIPLGKVWIHFFSLQLWENCRAD